MEKEKFSVLFTFDSGLSKEIIVEEENYSIVASKVMGNEKWFGIKGKLINLDNVNYVEIKEYQEKPATPGAVQVEL